MDNQQGEFLFDGFQGGGDVKEDNEAPHKPTARNPSVPPPSKERDYTFKDYMKFLCGNEQAALYWYNKHKEASCLNRRGKGKR